MGIVDGRVDDECRGIPISAGSIEAISLARHDELAGSCEG